jgi:hypothetical protein
MTILSVRSLKYQPVVKGSKANSCAHVREVNGKSGDCRPDDEQVRRLVGWFWNAENAKPIEGQLTTG